MGYVYNLKKDLQNIQTTITLTFIKELNTRRENVPTCTHPYVCTPRISLSSTDLGL